MKIIKNILKFFVDFLFIIVVVFLLLAIYNFVQIKSLGKDYANYLDYTFFEVQTGSMEDTIYVNDFVFVDLNASFKEDDIITFYYKDSIVTHRIIEMKDDYLITKGDANNTQDEPITYDDVIGKVVFIGHEYGTYFKVIKNPLVLGLIAVLMILLGYVLDDKKKEVNISNEEKEQK